LSSIEEFFRKRNRPMNPSVRKQALLPKGSEILFNPVGTAPGFSLRVNRCLFFFLPGVPFEMKRMLADQVLPRIAKHLGRRRDHRLIKTLACFGLTESLTGERLAGLRTEFPGVQLGLRAVSRNQVKLTPAALMKRRCRTSWKGPATGRGRGWGYRFSDSSEPMAAAGPPAAERKATLAVAELHGGLIST
jgi:nicotinamide-nucleotide amidase